MGFHVLTRISISDNLEKAFISCIYSASLMNYKLTGLRPTLRRTGPGFRQQYAILCVCGTWFVSRRFIYSLL